MKTDTLTVAPILDCLRVSSEFIKQPLNFKSVNPDQDEFLGRFVPMMDGLENLAAEIESVADLDYRVINAFLKKKGFDIQLPEPQGRTFSVASVLDILVKWLKKGTVTEVKRHNTFILYPAVELKSGVSFKKGLYGEPLVRIETQSGDIVWMMPVQRIPGGSSKFSILELICKADNGAWDGDNEGVIFPMIDYNRQVDISWIEGLFFHPDWFIQKALQQTRFRMNETGARAQSAVAMTNCWSCVMHRQPVVIDKPFLLWIERQRVRFPVFAGVFTEDVWKKPADLA
jgi:hypothetical protein